MPTSVEDDPLSEVLVSSVIPDLLLAMDQYLIVCDKEAVLDRAEVSGSHNADLSAARIWLYDEAELLAKALRQLEDLLVSGIHSKGV